MWFPNPELSRANVTLNILNGARHVHLVFRNKAGQGGRLPRSQRINEQLPNIRLFGQRRVEENGTGLAPDLLLFQARASLQRRGGALFRRHRLQFLANPGAEAGFFGGWLWIHVRQARPLAALRWSSR